MAKHILKILRCLHRKIFKVCLVILQHFMYERVKFVIVFEVSLNFDPEEEILKI